MPKIPEVLSRGRERLRDPVTWTEGTQLVKTAVAALAAWVVATEVFHLPQAFLAPWAALLVVHATVYRTFSEGTRQVAATVVGVALAWAVGNSLGLDYVALAVLLLAGLAIGKVSALRLDGTAIAATAVIVLTTGYSDDGHLLVQRFLDTAIGIAVGLFVNLIVWPPLRDRSAARAVDAIDDQVGDLLKDIAGQLHLDCDEEVAAEWVDRTQEIDDAIVSAWAFIRQARESGRLNPRRDAGKLKESGEFNDLLHRMEQALAEIRSMARTLRDSLARLDEWDSGFRVRWVRLLAEAGDAIHDTDSQRLAGVRLGLADLEYDLSTDDLPRRHWSEYGGLILHLRNIVTEMDWVADSNPVVSPAVGRGWQMFRG